MAIFEYYNHIHARAHMHASTQAHASICVSASLRCCVFPRTFLSLTEISSQTCLLFSIYCMVLYICLGWSFYYFFYFYFQFHFLLVFIFFFSHAQILRLAHIRIFVCLFFVVFFFFGFVFVFFIIVILFFTLFTLYLFISGAIRWSCGSIPLRVSCRNSYLFCILLPIHLHLHAHSSSCTYVPHICISFYTVTLARIIILQHKIW